MFDFQKLEVYQKSKLFHTEIIAFIRNAQIHKATADQLFRASLSIPLNIAEGSGRFTAKDRGNFFIFERSNNWHKFKNLGKHGASWWMLQHCYDFKPFITDIRFKVKLKGFL